MGTNAIYFTPITDTQKVLTILVEVSFQKASIIKLIYTKYSIYERRKKVKHVAMTYGSILINL